MYEFLKNSSFYKKKRTSYRHVPLDLTGKELLCFVQWQLPHCQLLKDAQYSPTSFRLSEMCKKKEIYF